MPSERARAVILTANWLSLPARCSASAVAMSLAERVTSERMASLTVMVWPGLQAELGWRLGSGVFRHGDSRVEGDAAGLQRLEDEVERHHLGERRRVGLGVGIARTEHLAGLGVDDDFGARHGKRLARSKHRQRGDRRCPKPGKAKVPKRFQSLPDHMPTPHPVGRYAGRRPNCPVARLYRSTTYYARPQHACRWRALRVPLT